jgi:glycosyltransferase involved in cell wall biosynthesis
VRPSDVSLIVTVKNEARSIQGLLDSIAKQTSPPSEIVIVDAGSTDDTVECIEGNSQRLPIKLLVREGANISRGRNEAVRAASGKIIASADAGVRLVPRWVEHLTQPFDDPSIDVVSGFFHPDPQTPFEAAMGATVLPVEENVDPRSFLPSSRSVAFRREAWDEVGGYPEWLDFCEDLVFDFALLSSGHKFTFVPEAVAYFRPRGNLGAFGRQYHQYARGDGKADLWRKRHAIRYLTYLVGVPLVVALGALLHPLWWSLLVVGAAAYLWTPYQRLRPMPRELSLPDKVKAVLWVPVIRLWGDLAKMIGYPVGVVWRLRHAKDIPDRQTSR